MMDEFESNVWDEFFMAPIDAGCLAFILQTSDVKLMTSGFARLAQSPRSVHTRVYQEVPLNLF
jgi:hypothetical protein